MGEETNIAEPMSSEDVVAAESVTADEPPKEHHRKRKKQLYKSLRELMEFYLGDVNLNKNRFMSKHTKGQPFVYVDLSLFLTFNKIKALNATVKDLAKALAHSEILQVSEDETQVCRKTPIMKKTDEDECTIYVEQLPPNIDHDILTKMFSVYGIVDYVSLPRFANNHRYKGFGFIEFRDSESAKKALEAFQEKGCHLSLETPPHELMSIKKFDQSLDDRIVESESDVSPEYNNLNIENEPEINNAGTENKNSSTKTSATKAEKKKRRSNDSVEKAHKKPKRHSKEAERSEHSTQNECVDQVDKKNSKASMKSKSISNTHKQAESVKQQPKASSSNENSDKKGESEDKVNRKKRKHLSQSESDVKTEEKALEPMPKKTKSDLEDESGNSQTEGENKEDAGVKQKRRRQKKKKTKKLKATPFSLGLQVLSKKEWKVLRNRYLTMQRTMMGSLKNHLLCSRKLLIDEATTKKFTPELGTIIKVTLEEAVRSGPSAKSEMRIHPDIKYVDITEGSPVVYLRTATPELASSLVQDHHWSTMEILKGDEETEYWNKMKMDRDGLLKRTKPNYRGRTKLLKRAEQYQGQPIKAFQSPQCC